MFALLSVKAARLYAPRKLRVEEITTPSPPPGWALVRSVAVGVCGTDKAFYTGTYPLFKSPITLGHEVAGIVEEGPEQLRGKLVVPEINFPCGECDMCRAGLYTHCPRKKTLGIDFDGGLAEYFVAPVIALHAAEGVDPATATEVEPLAAVLNALAQHPLPPRAACAVMGTGNLAVLAAQVLRLAGAECVVVAREDSPKKGHLESLGFKVLTLQEAKEYVRGETEEGQGFDAVFEVSGNPTALEMAIELARPRGVIHLKSTPGAPFTANLTKAVVKELRIVGTRCGTFREFKAAIGLLRSGLVKPIISSVVEGVESSAEALERSLRREEVKVVIKL